MHRRGVFIGRGTCAFLSCEKRPARAPAVLCRVLCAHGALSTSREEARRLRGRDAGALCARGKMGARRDLAVVPHSLRGDACGLGRPRAPSFSLAFPFGACNRAAVFAQGDKGDLPSEFSARSAACRVRARLCARGDAHLRSSCGRGDGRTVRGHERSALRARAARCGKGGEISGALCAPFRAPYPFVRLRGARRRVP